MQSTQDKRKKETFQRHRLKALRVSKDITQAELAERIGVGVETICFLESGRTRYPQLETVIRLAEALEVDMPCFWDPNKAVKI